MRTAFEFLNKLRFYSTLEILRLLPLPWAIRWMKVSARVFYCLCPRHRRQAIDWLRETVPTGTPLSEIRSLGRQLFVQAAFRRYLGYLLMLHDANDCGDLLEVKGWDRVEQALGRNKGVVLLTCHLGLPRVERWFLRTQPHRVYYLFRIGFPGERDQSWGAKFQRWHQTRYRQDADELFGNEELSVQYMKKAYDHLRRNGIVNIAGDGESGRCRYPVTIRGRQHDFGAGGISLGFMTGAAILPCFTVADATPRFHIEIQEPLASPLASHPTGSRTVETKALVEAYAARIEAYILRNPTNVVYANYSLRIPA